MNLNSRRYIGFAHDAASANVVFSYLYKYKDRHQCILNGKGPAENIFKKRVPDLFSCEDVKFGDKDIVVTGLSGVHSNYELDMIRVARSKNVEKIISILDTPYGLDERFEIDGRFIGEKNLPDVVYIPSRKVVSEKYKSLNNILKYIPNPYIKWLKEYEYNTIPKNIIHKNGNIKYFLYLTEYIKDQYGSSLGYDEYTLLYDFLTLFSEYAPSDISLVVKLHPQEDIKKYDSIIEKFPSLNVSVKKEELYSLLYYADAVFGNMSSVFVESKKILNKPSFSLQLEAKKFFYETPATVIKTKKQLSKILEMF